MNQIGLLTYHHVVNVGSILQTICAYRLLELLYPKSRIEIIDYYPEESRIYNERNARIQRGWKRAQKGFDHFLRSQCTFSSFRVRGDDKSASDVFQAGIAAYDQVFVGSDTVFQINGYFGSFIAGPPAPNFYHLVGGSATRHVGLAVSFDPFLEEDLSEAIADQLKGTLRGFKTILYRDRTSEEILIRLGVPEARIAYSPDPTILMDPSFLARSTNEFIPPVKPTAGVAISNTRIRDAAMDCLHHMNFEVINVLHPPSSTKWGLHKSNPLVSQLAVYRGLSGLITDRFHGSILAMQLGDAPVIGIEDASRYTYPNSKLRDLYQRLGLEHRFLRVNPETVTEHDFRSALQRSIESKAEIMHRFASLRSEGMRNIARMADLV